MDADGRRLVENERQSRQTFSLLETEYFSEETPLNYRAGLSPRCCQMRDSAALRCIVVWMCTVAVVVFVALVVEIVHQDTDVKIGDVVTDHVNCSHIGAEILRLGGNAVDAAVAAAVCLTVAVPHLASLGGGGYLLLHQLRTNKTVVLDFRERAPISLPIQRYQDNPGIAVEGRGSVATPGLLAGLKVAWEKYGSHQVALTCCSWFDLVFPTVALLDEGFEPSSTWARLLLEEEWAGQEEAGEGQELAEFLAEGGYSRSAKHHNRAMRQLMEEIYRDPANFYTGDLAQKIASDLKGQISIEDLAEYTVEERSPLTALIGNYLVYTSPAPAAGPAVLAILTSIDAFLRSTNQTLDGPGARAHLRTAIRNALEEQERLGDPALDMLHREDSNYTTIIQRTEAMLSEENINRWLADKDETAAGSKTRGKVLQQGTSITVMDNQDNYVAVSLSLGSTFGSRIFAQGIIFNNALANFDTAILTEPVAENITRNQFSEGIRPLSTSSPLIAVDTKDVCGTRVILAGNGPEAVAQVVLPLLLSPAEDLLTAVSDPRMVWINNTLSVEEGPGKFHPLKDDLPGSTFPGHPINALEKRKNAVHGVADSRAGQPEGRWADLIPKFT